MLQSATGVRSSSDRQRPHVGHLQKVGRCHRSDCVPDDSLPQVFDHHQTDRGENWQPFEAEIKDTQWSGLIGYVSDLY